MWAKLLKPAVKEAELAGEPKGRLEVADNRGEPTTIGLGKGEKVIPERSDGDAVSVSETRVDEVTTEDKWREWGNVVVFVGFGLVAVFNDVGLWL